MNLNSFVRVLTCCGLVVLCGRSFATPLMVYAQQPPQLPPITGTVAIEGTVEKTAAGADVLAVKTAHGLAHVFHLTQHTVVHGANDAGDASLTGLDEGTHVVVHCTKKAGRDTAVEIDRVGGGGLDAGEGVVTHVDREGKKLTIRMADGSIETFRLSERLANDVGKEIDDVASGTGRVAVYYTNDAGEKVVHFLKRIP